MFTFHRQVKKPKDVLVGCEYTGIVWSAFTGIGHMVTSCDIIPSELSTRHYQGDVRNLLKKKWHIAIFHPPCTLLARSGARWWKGQEEKQQKAIDFVLELWNSDIDRIAIENPIGILSRAEYLGKPNQIIQPWMFGHGETKATCLWLKNLPNLVPSNIVEGRENRIHKIPPQVKDRGRERSRTYTGIAAAMASQWGFLDE